MIVTVDLNRFAAAGLAFEAGDGEGAFRLVKDEQPSADVLVRVPLAGDQLQFLPARSAAQRQVLKLLGLG